MMKTVLLAGAISGLLGNAAAFKVAEIANPMVNERYASGAVHMNLMATKESTFTRQLNAGAYNSSQYASIAAFTPCTNGKAAGYSCKNIDLYSYTSHSSLGSATGQGSSSWGWTSATGREIIIVAQVSSVIRALPGGYLTADIFSQADGAAFAEIKSDGSVTYLGRLPKQSTNSIWRGEYIQSYPVLSSH